MSARLRLVEGPFAISLLPPDADLPDWVAGPGLINVTRSEDELSILCLADRVPHDVESDRGWVAFKLAEAVAFDAAGVLLSIIAPISAQGIGVFAISTFHRDFVLVKADDLHRARLALQSSGHEVVSQ